MDDKERTRRLDRVAEQLARQCCFAIKDRVSDDGLTSLHPYAGQYILETIIKSLQTRV